MAVLTITIICLALLGLNEAWWRRIRKPDEFSRKFVHIVAGSFVATWPFFLSWGEIRVLGLLALAAVLLSQYFKVFQTIHAATRPTWGEIFFAVAVIAVTFVTHSKGIYAAALLQMSLADGLAAIVGTAYGKSNEYKVWGHTKSLAGTGTFLIISYVLLLGYALYSTALGVSISLLIAVAATACENVAVRGLDNLVVPIVVAELIKLLV